MQLIKSLRNPLELSYRDRTQMTMQMTGMSQKDIVGDPSGWDGLLYGNQTQGQLFSYCAGDVISDVVGGGSPINKWLPAKGTNVWNAHVAHISYITPEGHDGSQTYLDYLADQDAVGECDFGTGFDYDTCEYSHTMYRITMSNKDKPLNFEHFGMRYCEQSPIVRIRGAETNLEVDTDGEWAVAQIAIGLEHHLDFNTWFGDPAIASGTGMYDGLDNIITTGWVKNKMIGAGSCEFSDPLVVNGVNLTDPASILRVLKAMVRKIRQRMVVRGYMPRGDDMVISMPFSHWTYIADSIACGTLAASCANATMNLTPEVWVRERERVTSGGVGWGFIDIDGIPVAVVPDDLLGANVTLPDGAPGVTGDIYILTKKFRGMTILEHEYLDWDLLREPYRDNVTIFQNGMIRSTWIAENNICYYYGLDMWGRIVSKMQPFQGKLMDVTVESVLDNENESLNYASQDFYAFNGEIGGQGVALLNPI